MKARVVDGRRRLFARRCLVGATGALLKKNVENDGVTVDEGPGQRRDLIFYLLGILREKPRQGVNTIPLLCRLSK